MTAAEIVPADNLAALEHLDAGAREIAVTQYLTDARDRLAIALQATGPEAVAAIKAEIATAAEATKQLGLSKEIQTDAQEMVRRAQFALGKAIRAGQEAGQIQRPTDNRHTLRLGRTESYKPSPTDFAAQHELSGVHGSGGIYALVDGVSEPEFDAALSDARAEGNLSLANVARKVQGVKTQGLTPVERLKTIRELATTGRTSDQIAREVGVGEEYVRKLARENGIEIIADRVLRNTRRVDAVRVIESTVLDASNLISPSLLEQVDFAGLPRENLGEWISSLSESIKALRSLKSSLEKELHRG